MTSYCTKYSESKNIEEHNFKNIRWFQIADFLKQYKSNKTIRDFLTFLKNRNMAQDLTLTAQDFVTMGNLKNMILIAKGHLDRVSEVFEKTFKSDKNLSNALNISDIIKHERLVYFYKDIVDGKEASDIKYGIQLEKPNIYVSIWIDKKNEYHKVFSTLAKQKSDSFEIVELTSGTALELKQDISIYLNDENADKKIAQWFNDGFEKFADFVREHGSIAWKIKCPAKKVENPSVEIE